MKIFKYKDYSHYVKSQRRGFEKKKNNVWACEENIKFLSEYLKKISPKNGLCHGTRKGHEQKWFMKYIKGCKVIGSEIGDNDFENTTQWDFNKINNKWINQFDFIYSNSFDHAFNPEETLKVWAGQLKLGGLMILEYDKRNEHTGEISMKVNKIDPVSITIDELVKVIPKWIEKVKIIDVLDMPVIGKVFQKSIIVQVG